MRSIKDLSACFDSFIANMKDMSKKALDQTAERMLKDAKDGIELPAEARNIQQFVEYEASLKKSEMIDTGDECFASVYSDLVVQDGSKWDGVPIGAFLEWGTGPLGESTNDYPHGYPYTTEHPWDAHTHSQLAQTGTWGIAARPHLYMALVANRHVLIENVKDETQKAWNS